MGQSASSSPRAESAPSSPEPAVPPPLPPKSPASRARVVSPADMAAVEKLKAEVCSFLVRYSVQHLATSADGEGVLGPGQRCLQKGEARRRY